MTADQITAISVLVASVTGLIYAIIRLVDMFKSKKWRGEMLEESKRRRRLLASQCDRQDEITGEHRPYAGEKPSVEYSGGPLPPERLRPRAMTPPRGELPVRGEPTRPVTRKRRDGDEGEE